MAIIKVGLDVHAATVSVSSTEPSLARGEIQAKVRSRTLNRPGQYQPSDFIH